MQPICHFIVLFVALGLPVTISTQSVKNLNKKIESLQKSFQHEMELQKALFQREISDLKYTVLRLQTELAETKTQFEDLLNGTEAAVDHQERTHPKASEKSDEGDMIQAQATLSRKELQKQMEICSVLHKAFQDVKVETKHAVGDLRSEQANDKKVLEGFGDRVSDLKDSVVSLTEQTTSNAEGLASVQNEQSQIKQELSVLGDGIADLNNKSANLLEATIVNNDKLETLMNKATRLDLAVTDLRRTGERSLELIDQVQRIVWIQNTSLAQLEEAVRNISDVHKGVHSLEPSANFTCLRDIQAGGETMAKHLYVGVTVRRGKDWNWRNQDGGGLGKIRKIPDDLKAHWVSVSWDNGHDNNYRMGVNQAYDLEIVEDEFDVSKCKAT